MGSLALGHAVVEWGFKPWPCRSCTLTLPVGGAELMKTYDTKNGGGGGVGV